MAGNDRWLDGLAAKRSKMKKALVKAESKIWRFVDGNKVDGPHGQIYGDVSGIRGNVSGIRGDVYGIRGDVSGICGDVSGIRGDVSGIRGNIDECGLTEDDRKRGVNISDLIG